MNPFIFIIRRKKRQKQGATCKMIKKTVGVGALDDPFKYV